MLRLASDGFSIDQVVLCKVQVVDIIAPRPDVKPAQAGSLTSAWRQHAAHHDWVQVYPAKCEVACTDAARAFPAGLVFRQVPARVKLKTLHAHHVKSAR